ncbi:hypothetical protein TrRE_jg7175 [Triparma retinervis]|uniref:Uncharacterized protein n=1 Tax=Triparma retinervis TaxID=2557542 RepID=A0A9W6Z7X1_9STRA|nr:hypothetical protein TrRE_jg7175 [Triparma retinervis]
MYEVGTLVTVKSRTWAGINKQGGVGKITSSTFTSCSVKYVLGGSDKDIPTEFVTPFEEEGKRDRVAVGQGEEREIVGGRGGARREGREQVFREVDVNDGGASPEKRVGWGDEEQVGCKKKKKKKKKVEEEAVIEAKPITEVVLDKLSPPPQPMEPVNPLTSKFTTFLLRLMSGSDEIAISEIRQRWIEEGGMGGDEVEGLVGGMEQRNVVMVDEGMVYKI